MSGVRPSKGAYSSRTLAGGRRIESVFFVPRDIRNNLAVFYDTPRVNFLLLSRK